MSQLATVAASDHLGRKWMIVAGMLVQGVGIGLFVVGTAYAAWVLAAVLLGFGAALVFPTLIAAVSDVAHPSWRASAVGVYRLWRDFGYAYGGLLSDAMGMPFTITAVGILTFTSGVIVAGVMQETKKR